MFRTVPLSIIRSLALYTQQWYMSYRFCWQLASRITMELHPDPPSGQFLCPSSGVFHRTHSRGICHTVLLTACERDQDGTPSWSSIRTVPLSIIRSFSLYTQPWYMSHSFADSLRAGSGWNSILILHPDSSSVHHQEFFTVHTAMVYVIQVCWQLANRIRTELMALILLARCQQTCMTYTIAVCTVKHSWLWTEELSETCRVLFQKYIWEISASSWGVFFIRIEQWNYHCLPLCLVTCVLEMLAFRINLSSRRLCRVVQSSMVAI